MTGEILSSCVCPACTCDVDSARIALDYLIEHGGIVTSILALVYGLGNGTCWLVMNQFQNNRRFEELEKRSRGGGGNGISPDDFKGGTSQNTTPTTFSPSDASAPSSKTSELQSPV